MYDPFLQEYVRMRQIYNFFTNKKHVTSVNVSIRWGRGWCHSVNMSSYYRNCQSDTDNILLLWFDRDNIYCYFTLIVFNCSVCGDCWLERTVSAEHKSHFWMLNGF